MLKCAGYLQGGNPFHVGNVCSKTHVGERSLLSGSFGQVGKGIVAGVEVETIPPAKSSDGKKRGRIEQMSPARSDVKRLNLGALVLSNRLLIERIRSLKPRPRVAQVKVD